MMSFFGSDDLGEGSIWDSGLDIFGKSTISKLLEGGVFTIEELLTEDEFIQETQGQAKPLSDFLTSPSGLHGLVRYLAVPQRATDENRAFRFPFMAAEAVCCDVPVLLEALTSRKQSGVDHLTMLFSIVAPALRSRIVHSYNTDNSGDEDDLEVAAGRDSFLLGQGHPSRGSFEIRPYLAGYAAKVMSFLCRARPSAMMRFLDRTPGIGAGMVGQLSCGSVAAMLETVMSLPWACDGKVGMSTLRLSRADEYSMPHLLLQCMEEAVGACSLHSGMPAVGAATAAEHAADVLVSLLNGSIVSPHSKFNGEEYNTARLAKVRAGPSIDHSPTGPGEVKEDVDVEAVLVHDNVLLDATFHDSRPLPTDPLLVRLLKEFRDGPSGRRLVSLAVAAAGVLCAFTEAAQCVPTSVQTACDAPLRVLNAVLQVCAFSYRHQVFLGHGVGSNGAGLIGPCPALLIALSQGPMQLLVGSLEGICRDAAATVHAFLSTAPLPETRSPVSGGTRPAKPPAPGACRAPVVGADVEKGVAPPPSYRAAPTLGAGGLSLVRCLATTLKCCWPEVDAAQSLCGGSRAILTAMHAFPWHSILHKSVADALVDALHEGSPASRRMLLADARLLTQLVSLCRLSQLPCDIAGLGAPRKVRVGYTGHAVAVASALLSAHARGLLPSQVAPMLASHSDWWTVVDRELAVAGIAHGVLLGGLAPDVKASGNVGASADATGGPSKAAAVDEVAALEGDDEDNDRRSFGSDEEDEHGHTGKEADRSEQGERDDGGREVQDRAQVQGGDAWAEETEEGARGNSGLASEDAWLGGDSFDQFGSEPSLPSDQVAPIVSFPVMPADAGSAFDFGPSSDFDFGMSSDMESGTGSAVQGGEDGVGGQLGSQSFSVATGSWGQLDDTGDTDDGGGTTRTGQVTADNGSPVDSPSSGHGQLAFDTDVTAPASAPLSSWQVKSAHQPSSRPASAAPVVVEEDDDPFASASAGWSKPDGNPTSSSGIDAGQLQSFDFDFDMR